MKHSLDQLPRSVIRFLEAICPPGLLEEIEGDLLECYNEDIRHYGKGRAKRRLVWNAFRYMRPGIIFRNSISIHNNQLTMIRSYMLIMIRSLMKRKIHAAINVFGLTAGIMFAVTLGVFIYGELQVNQDFKDVEQLYFLESHHDVDGDGDTWMAPAALLPEWMQSNPGKIDAYYRFWDRQITVAKVSVTSGCRV